MGELEGSGVSVVLLNIVRPRELSLKWRMRYYSLPLDLGRRRIRLVRGRSEGGQKFRGVCGPSELVRARGQFVKWWKKYYSLLDGHGEGGCSD